MVIRYGGMKLILEEDKIVDIRQMLSTIITKVYNNEKDFIEHFFQHLVGHELEEFYMASSICRVQLWHGMEGSTTEVVRTQDVLDWLDELNN